MKEYTFTKKAYNLEECEKIRTKIVEDIYNKISEKLKCHIDISSRCLFNPLKMECKVTITVYEGC